MRVLIVRLSSMGDLVQTLPALSDGARAFPEIRFDWAVDESFAQVPSWHTHVDRVFASNFRRWSKEPSKAISSGEFGGFLKALRAQRYDRIVDVQGEWKSAMVARSARGPHYGYDGSSVHEWGAHLLYGNRFAVPKGEHSIRRMRQLLSKALNYSYDENDLGYSIDRSRLIETRRVPEPYVVFIHSTSWSSKNWPEHYWRDLALRVVRNGLRVVLPWGSEDERERSERISAGDERILVLPQLSISEKASIISRAVATVGLDTGLSHIAAALEVPSISLYGATDPALVGATGRNQIHLASHFECVRCHQVNCTYDGPAEFKPACFVEVRPDLVWESLEKVLQKSGAGLHKDQ